MSDPAYNVFISWSGERSKAAASALYKWLPMVVQTASPWMSAEDIEKGSRSQAEITKALAEAKVGIICLTPENLNKPWVLFEAGAISKTLNDTQRVCTYLLGNLQHQDVPLPLGMFQGTKAVKDDTRKMVGTVNNAVGGSLEDGALDTVFEKMWEVLEQKLLSIPTSVHTTEATSRSEREMIAEILELSRISRGTIDVLRPLTDAVVQIARTQSRMEQENLRAYYGQASTTGWVGGEGFGGIARLKTLSDILANPIPADPTLEANEKPAKLDGEPEDGRKT